MGCRGLYNVWPHRAHFCYRMPWWRIRAPGTSVYHPSPLRVALAGHVRACWTCWECHWSQLRLKENNSECHGRCQGGGFGRAGGSRYKSLSSSFKNQNSVIYSPRCWWMDTSLKSLWLNFCFWFFDLFFFHWGKVLTLICPQGPNCPTHRKWNPFPRSPEKQLTRLSLSSSGCLAYLLLWLRQKLLKECQATIGFIRLSEDTLHNSL